MTTITGLRASGSARFLLGRFAEARAAFETILQLYRENEDARLASRKDRLASEESLRDAPPLLTRAVSAPVAPPTQLDLRGLRRDEATEALDRYLNDAYLGGLQKVRVVHGKGTGAVRAAVREQLSGHALVSRFQSADAREGGEGATEVTLAS